MTHYNVIPTTEWFPEQKLAFALVILNRLIRTRRISATEFDILNETIMTLWEHYKTTRGNP